MLKLVLCCILSYSFAGFAQLNDARRITKTLCSEEFHGRGYVNNGVEIASQFIAKEFKKIGAKPIKRNYFQAFQHAVNTFPGEMLVKQNERVLKPGTHFIVDPKSGGGKFDLYPNKITIATALNKQLLEDELKKMFIEKKFNAISFNSSHLSLDTLKKLETLKDELAHFIPVIEIVQSKFTWSVASEQLQFPIIQLHDSVYQQNAHYTIHLEAIELPNFTSKNVIAYLPGKNKKLAPFVFTAHYDHLGRMGSETYFPGANDNASGVAMLLEIARYFKANKPERSIYFIAFAGEEAGLLGSKHFVEHPLIPLKNIGFLMNVDIMGSGEDGVTIVNATLFEKAFKQLVAINEKKHFLKTIKSRGPAANSDHYWFTKAGVPAFFMYTMGPNKNYHDVFDTFDALSFNEFNDIHQILIQFCQHFKTN
jgi:hypothetical protein